MELQQIGYFVTLARALNFTRAAQECRISQPALTKSVQRLEAELGGELLLRERGFTQLSDFGRSMLPLLQQVLDAAEIARNEARRLRHHERAALRLGISPWLAFPLLSPVLSEVAISVIGTEFSLTVATEESLRESMLRDELDVLVGYRPDVFPERFERWSLFTSVVTVFLPRDHSLAAEPVISPASLAAMDLVGASDPDALPEMVLSQLRRHIGTGFSSPHRAINWETSLQLVRAGLGLGLGLSCWPVPAELAARPLADPAIEHDIVVATLPGRQRSPAATAFVKLARARAWPAATTIT